MAIPLILELQREREGELRKSDLNEIQRADKINSAERKQNYDKLPGHRSWAQVLGTSLKHTNKTDTFKPDEAKSFTL